MDRNSPYNVYSLGNAITQGPWQQYISALGPVQGPSARDNKVPITNQQVDHSTLGDIQHPVRRMADEGLRRQGYTQEPKRTVYSSIDPGVTTSGTNVDNPRVQQDVKTTASNSAGSIANQVGQVAGDIVANTNRTTATGSDSTGNAGGSSDPSDGSGSAKTPFGKSFTGASYEDVWNNPDIMIQAFLEQSGLNPNTGLGRQMFDLGDRAEIQWLLQNNAAFSEGDAEPGTAQYLDWAGEYLDNMRTPGSSLPSVSSLLGTIMNPGQDTVMGSNMYNADMSPDQQVGAALSSIRYGLEGIAPSLILQSLLSRGQQLGREYSAMIATGGNQDGEYENFGDYMRQQGLM